MFTKLAIVLASTATNAQICEQLRDWAVENQNGRWLSDDRKEIIVARDNETAELTVIHARVKTSPNLFTNFVSAANPEDEISLDDRPHTVVLVFDRATWAKHSPWYNDISQETASQAYYATSFSPERRGQTIVNEYCEEMDTTKRLLTKLDAETEFEAYRDGYRRRLEAYLGAQSSVMSPMITGPANFPTARNQKRGATADRRWSDLTEWSQKFMKRVRKDNTDTGVIKSSDSDAVEKLQAKITGLKESQDRMKAANRIIRKKSSKPEDLLALNFTQEQAEELFKPDWVGRTGFADYQLTNNRADIKRCEARLAELQAVKSSDLKQQEIAPGLTLEENPEDYRIKFFFDEKPDADVRAVLKQNGFRFAPSSTAWQRHLNDNGRYAAKRVIEALYPDADYQAA